MKGYHDAYSRALVWADGYYNGAIKTRKMVQPVETATEEASFHRSLQLRELYESLSMGEDNQQLRRPCDALSPEDLTESEWFYLMCMSFVFPPGEGLPGRAFEKQQTVWLSGANEVDSVVFRRAILAKGAQIQTVVCIPIADGVLELGTTSKIQEDETLIQLMKSFFSEHTRQSTVNEEDEEEGDLSSQTELTEEILLAMSQEEELYSQTVSAVLSQNPSPWTQNPSPFDLIHHSAFATWAPGATAQPPREGQRMLKNALKWRFRKIDDLSANHVMAERRRREKLNERFVTLSSMVPCVTKADKASILGDTIEYLKKLLKRIEEMEAEMEVTQPERKRMKGMDRQLGFSGQTSVQVSIIEADALLEFQCENRDGLLLRMMQKIQELGFEFVAVQSNVSAGLLVAQIRAKEKGTIGRMTSIVEMKKALQHLILS